MGKGESVHLKKFRNRMYTLDSKPANLCADPTVLKIMETLLSLSNFLPSPVRTGGSIVNKGVSALKTL